MKCPKCRSTNISTERRPDGNSDCIDCGYGSQTSEFVSTVE
jgi:transcription initiation factor TFIIIB Brf1 subunit/transcription initiation factor TFIIB